MKENREHGKKKLATRCTSIILALVFVFSIFSGIVSAECVLINEEVVVDPHFVSAGEPKLTGEEWKPTDITCEEATWEGKCTYETEGNIEKDVVRTYNCFCTVTNKSEIKKEEPVTEKTPHTETETKPATATTGATCPEPCATKEQIEAAEIALEAAIKKYEDAKREYDSAKKAYDDNKEDIEYNEDLKKSVCKSIDSQKKVIENLKKTIKELENSLKNIPFFLKKYKKYIEEAIETQKKILDDSEKALSNMEKSLQKIEQKLKELYMKEKMLQQNLQNAQKNFESAKTKKENTQKELDRLKGLPLCTPVPQERPKCSYNSVGVSSHSSNKSPLIFYARTSSDFDTRRSFVQVELNDDLPTTETSDTMISSYTSSSPPVSIDPAVPKQDHQDISLRASNKFDGNDTLAVQQYDAFTGNFSDYGTDVDGDGLYDFLNIDVGVSVNIAGNYTMLGDLYDVNRNEIVWSINDTYLDIGNQTIKLYFDGKAIQKHGVNGPYYLKDLALLDENYELLGYIVDVYTTSAYDYTDFQTLIPQTQFTDECSDYGTDIDGDGLYDYLVIDIEVNVTIAGNYIISGLLYDVNGNEIVWADNDAYLPIGDQTMILYFDGEAIQRHGVNGPYYLKNLMLFDKNYVPLDYIVDAYTSSAYDYTDFQTLIPPTQFIGDHTDYGTDIDGDGLYDCLTIDVGVNVTATGNYAISGLLYDVNANEIVWAGNDAYLNMGNQTINLYFDGKKIQKHGVNGPYYLKNITLTDENYKLIDYIVDAYTTSAYDYADFQTLKPPAAQFMNDYSDYGTDINGDGLFDYLTIDVGVNVTSAGDYSISGGLCDVNGNEIVCSFNDTELYVGSRTIKLNFNGRAIQKHGINGPYHLKNLTLLDENYELLDYTVDAYTTFAYNSMDFQTPLAAEFTGIYSDYGTDIDGDGLYNYLTLDVGVDVTFAGNYSLEGWLYDVNGTDIVWSSNSVHLNVGNQIVGLNFDGKDIQEHGVTGSYYLKNLILLDENSIVLDYIVDAYTTAAYNYADFQTPPTQFTDNYFDYGTDIDGDGLYDYLTIDVGVKVTSGGNYNVEGLLYGVDGSIVASTSNDTYLDVGVRSVLLNFDGVKIRRHGVNTPFDLSHLILYDKNNNLVDYRDFAYTTSAYLYSDFEIGFIGKCSDYGIDIDGDGLYEYLTIDVGVNILTAGDYSLMGYLYDANGTEIVWSIEYGSLDIGNHIMNLNFDGETIQTHGVNGPYYLKHLLLSSGKNWTFIDYIPDAYTTSAYNYSDFGGFYWTIVEIDIKPGSYPNSINLKSKGKVPVAVLTNGDFDASTVDTSTVVFAGAEPVKWSMKDVNGDGDIDMLFHFKTQELNLDEDSTEAMLTGDTTDGKHIKGTDSVNIVPESESEELYGYLTIDVDGTAVRDYTISGVGFGELSLITFFQDTIPVFSGTYIYELMGINISSRQTNFTITTSEVKNLKLGIKKDNRIWMSQTSTASGGIATASSDLPSPGNYHVKIFGDAAEGASRVDLKLSADYKITASGTFNLTVNNSGFPAGKYTIAAKVLNGDFTNLTLDGIDFKLVKPVWDEINAEFDARIEMVNTVDKPSLLDKLESARALKDNALEEYNADNIELAQKKLGEAKREVESFEKEVKRTKGISREDKASFLEKSAVIIEKIDELIGALEGLPLIP